MTREIAAHVVLLQDDYRGRGLSADQASRAARVAFGGIEQIKERHRYTRSFALLEDIRRDLAYAIRSLGKTPIATVIAILSLALGIGATTAVYSTMDWLLNRSPGGMVEPDRVLSLQVTDRARPSIGTVGLSFQQYLALLEFQDAFTSLASYGKRLGVVSTDTRADQVVVEYATGNYFELLGVGPALGRILHPSDDIEGAAPVVMLSHAFWQSHFGGDPSVLDRPIRLSGHPTRVVGIVPPEFEGYNLDWNGPTTVWMPVQTAQTVYQLKIRASNIPFVRVVGRLRSGVTQEMVEQRSRVWMTRLPAGRSGMFEATDLAVRPGRQMRIRYRDGTEKVLDALLTVCVLILLAANFNIANFLLNRGVIRRREMAVRVTLGASRARLLRQLLTESLLIAGCASAAGLLISFGVAYVLSPIHRMYLGGVAGDLSTFGAADVHMGLVAAALGVASILAFGLMPALYTSSCEPLSDLKQALPHWTWSGIRVTFRQVLLACQVAAVVALAIPAGLYAHSFFKVASVQSVHDDPEHVLVATLITSASASPARSSFHDQLLSTLRARPEVAFATFSGAPPLVAGTGSTVLPGSEDRREHPVVWVGPDYFATQGVPMVAGREFAGSEEDNRTAVIVNEVLGQLWWPGQTPVGQSLVVRSNDDELRIVVGVASDNKCANFLSEPTPCAWTPFKQPAFTATSGYLQIRTREAPMAFVSRLREVVQQMDPDAAIANEATLADLIEQDSAVQRFSALSSATLALIGIGLLAFGLLALFLSMVRDSVREIAIRMALGASSRALTWRIATQGLLLLVPGVLIGMVVARVLGLRIADQLYHVTPTEPLTFIFVPLLIVMIGLSAVGYASFVATRTDLAMHLQRD